MHFPAPAGTIQGNATSAIVDTCTHGSLPACYGCRNPAAARFTICTDREAEVSDRPRKQRIHPVSADRALRTATPLEPRLTSSLAIMGGRHDPSGRQRQDERNHEGFYRPADTYRPSEDRPSQHYRSDAQPQPSYAQFYRDDNRVYIGDAHWQSSEYQRDAPRAPIPDDRRNEYQRNDRTPSFSGKWWRPTEPARQPDYPRCNQDNEYPSTGRRDGRGNGYDSGYNPRGTFDNRDMSAGPSRQQVWRPSIPSEPMRSAPHDQARAYSSAPSRRGRGSPPRDDDYPQRPRTTEPPRGSRGAKLHLRRPPMMDDYLRADTPQYGSSSASASNASSRGATRASSPRAKPFAVTLPDEDYLRLSVAHHQASTSQTELYPKLLILDLNGALVYRNAKTGEKRKAYPRPYLGCFLQYVFLPDASTKEEKRDKGAEAVARPYEVFVWSSAQPHNVRNMVESTFGLKWCEGTWETEKKRVREERLSAGEGRILKVWARDMMGLNASDYGRKVQTTKDLRKVIDFFRESNANDLAHLPAYDERNCILIDDSPLKAVCQPWNQLVIPEYDKKEFQDSRDVAARLARNPNANTEDLDQILLGVIGILEEMRTVPNVPAWIRAGGLFPLAPQETMPDTRRTPRISDLPSHETFRHWYQQPEQLAYWIDRGRKALERRGIALEIGTLDGTGAMSPSPQDQSDEASASTASVSQRLAELSYSRRSPSE